MTSEKSNTLPRGNLKGRNPHFFKDPNIDRLIGVVMELASEVSVLRDRLDTHERLAGQSGVYDTKAVEEFVPSEEEAADRDARRSDFLDRILKSLYAEFNESPNIKT
jgi:hypothetical protein